MRIRISIAACTAWLALALPIGFASPEQGVALGGPGAASQPVPQVRIPRPHELAVSPQLMTPVAQADFRSAPLEQVLNWIREIGGVNLVVQYDALEELGIERDKPVTVELRNVQLSAVLWTTLQSAGGTDVALGWEVAQDGTVTVSTRDSLGRDLHTRIYDVRELLMNLSRWERALRLAYARQAVESARLPRPPAPWDLVEQRILEAAAAVDVGEELREAIRQTIEPDTWMEVGGRSTAYLVGGLLTVRAPLAVHRQLTAFLDALSAMASQPQRAVGG